MKPKISFVIPTYNRSKILAERSVRSIQRQTFDNWELVIIDDGSTDDTEEIARRLGAGDKRIKYFKKENGGQTAARNYGVLKANGEYIGFLDDDDEFLPESAALAVGIFEREKVDFVGGVMVLRDEFGMDTCYVPHLEPVWDDTVGTGWFFKRELFAVKHLFFDEKIVGVEDYDLRLQLHLAHCRGYVIQKPFMVYYATFYNKSTHSVSTDPKRKIRGYEAFREKYLPLYKSFGPEAEAWMYHFGALMYMESAKPGDPALGRDLFRKALGLKFSFRTLFYYLASFGGRKFFKACNYFKIRIMRIIRKYILNPKLDGR